MTDAGGLSASADAMVTVQPELYYPPQALAGEDKLIKFPNNQISLDGSKSKSFKVSRCPMQCRCTDSAILPCTGRASIHMGDAERPRFSGHEGHQYTAP